MKQLLRITHDESDYTYQIANEAPISSTTTELEVIIEGHKYIIARDNKRVWVQKEGDTSMDPEVLNAIGRTVSLRYRLYI